LNNKLAEALEEIEKEQGIDILRQILADCLAATCLRTSSESSQQIYVEKDFVSADITISINK